MKPKSQTRRAKVLPRSQKREPTIVVVRDIVVAIGFIGGKYSRASRFPQDVLAVATAQSSTDIRSSLKGRRGLSAPPQPPRSHQ